MAQKRKNKKLTRLARERMKATGENYTRARRAVIAEYEAAQGLVEVTNGTETTLRMAPLTTVTTLPNVDDNAAGDNTNANASE